MTEDLIAERHGPVLRLVLNRPRARNALTFAMYEGIARHLEQAGRDDAVRAVILTGAGGEAFAAGTDIGQFRDLRTAADALAYEARIDRILSAIEDCPKPTIAAIAGACTGGGAAIAAVCDLRLAAANARYGFPIARTLGNTLSMANHRRLAALVGPARVTELVFTARLLDAGEMREAGLASEILPDDAALQTRALALAEQVAGHAPLTLLATKRALQRLRRDGPAAEGDDLVAMCFTSADFREGVDSFLARRPARWQGR